MKPPSAFLLLLLLATRAPVWAQSVPMGAPVPAGYGTPPPIIYAPSLETAHPTVLRTDPASLRREAREILELSQSLQGDIESLNRGLFPKDMTHKLTRIEKLSKHLRGEISSR